MKNTMLKTMKNTCTVVTVVLGLGISSSAFAAASSQVVWDKATRDLIKFADSEKGKQTAEVCSSCHGKDGTATLAENFPSLSGQPAGATYKQLMDYKDNTRGHGIMQNFATTLSRQDMANLAVYYSQQSLPTAKTGKTVTETAIRLARKGDGDRLLPPCATCHGDKGEGATVDVPALAGQNPSYFVTIMRTFKSGTRANDIYNRMRIIASALSDQEINELADYYASLGTK